MSSPIPALRPEAPIRLRLLGALELDGRPEADAILTQPKRAALVAYLAGARPFGFHRRDRLVGLFWPEHSQEHARAALRKAVFAIRQALGEDAIVGRGDEEIALDPLVVWTDVRAFHQAQTDEHFARALELYRGPFLDAFHADAPGFERWADETREAVRDEAARAAWALAERYEGASDLTQAARWARKVVTLSPSDERALRRVLKLLHRAGDRAGAVRVYEEFAAKLRAEYDVEPSSETQELMRTVRAG